MPDAHSPRQDLELAGNLGLVNAGGEQLGPAQPAAWSRSRCRGEVAEEALPRLRV
jgi:hypothetical protein